MTHTPGPWTVDIVKDTGDWTFNIRTQKPHNPAGGVGKHIATVNQYIRTEDHNDSAADANARLIAAAPAMLEALKALDASDKSLVGIQHQGKAAISVMYQLAQEARSIIQLIEKGE